MAISVISGASGGSLPSPAAACPGEAGSDAGGFGGLLALLRAGGNAGEVDAEAFDLLMAEPGTTGQDGNTPLFAQLLPEEIQALLREAELRQTDAESAEEGAESLVLLGSLSIPALPLQTETTPAISLTLAPKIAPEGEAQEEDRAPNHLATLLQAARHGKELPPSSASNPANIAADPENFGEIFKGKADALPQERLTPPNPLATPSAATQSAGMAAPGAVAQNLPAPQNPPASGLQTPLQDARWAQEFGERIVWMVRNDQQQAQLRLNPAHLGPLQIQLTLDTDKASALFSASTPEVRQAIEEALPRLREMLAGAGVTLGEAEVHSESRQEAFLFRQESRQHGNNSRSGGDQAILEGDFVSPRLIRASQGAGLVDLFA
ncbi:MAG: flagellar hook-length control protein FliK [Zoogloeaceae bacterium]|jgi:flagellar hook-length control protein FliK|nr:flagellar hook-length control protein FliK [Zoogloeaceae bacterium]